MNEYEICTLRVFYRDNGFRSHRAFSVSYKCISGMNIWMETAIWFLQSLKEIP